MPGLFYNIEYCQIPCFLTFLVWKWSQSCNSKGLFFYHVETTICSSKNTGCCVCVGCSNSVPAQECMLKEGLRNTVPQYEIIGEDKLEDFSFQKLHFLFYLFCGTGVWTQGLTLAGQMFCNLRHSASPVLCLRNVWDGGLTNYLPGLASNHHIPDQLGLQAWATTWPDIS
jgi:hypothetical protein